METLKNYLLAITAAAIICAIARSLCEEKTVSGSMIRLIAGIVMTVTVLSPVVKLKFDDLPDLSADFSAEAATAGSVFSGSDSPHPESKVKHNIAAIIFNFICIFLLKFFVY